MKERGPATDNFKCEDLLAHSLSQQPVDIRQQEVGGLGQLHRQAGVEDVGRGQALMDESGGLIDTVSDDEILAAYKLLAVKEGVFVEPASAASVAGILKLKKRGYFNERRTTNECEAKRSLPGRDERRYTLAGRPAC